MMKKILYIDDEQDNLFTFQINLKKYFKVFVTDNPLDALDIVKKESIKVVISDQRMPEMCGLEVAKKVHEELPSIVFIILTAFDDNETILQAINQGDIYRYMFKPWDVNDLKQTLDSAFRTFDLKRNNVSLINDLLSKNRKLVAAYEEISTLKKELEEENVQLKEELVSSSISSDIIGHSKVMKDIYRQVEQAAKTNSTVLLLGETGTGKEIFAKAIHLLSNRKEKVLVKINCAAIPETLIESELFGHEKGAFTGADKLKYGKFEVADNGTLFLDEIGEMPLSLQPKLLRVLQEGEYERLGSNKVNKTDFRLIAATNRKLEQEVEKGKFRSDLYYRLNVLPIFLPPLREHKEDIHLLVNYFIGKLNRKSGKIIDNIPQKVMLKLQEYHWPGNVRELENIIERAHVLSTSRKLELGDWFSPQKKKVEEDDFTTLAENEREHILKALKITKWKIRGNGGAAELLQINPSTLESRMKRLGISRPI